MSNVLIVLGESGSGKSTSIKTLDPASTGIISVLGKVPPFKGAKSKYNSENKNFFIVSSWDKIVSGMQYLAKQENIKTIILDDLFFSMSEENFARAGETGYKRFSDMALHMQQILFTAKSLPEHITVVCMMHPENIVSNGCIVGKGIKLVGKMVHEQYTPEALCNIVLYCKPRFNDKGAATYGFFTHAFKEGDCEYLCKSPDEMFEEDFIPNDLQLVIDSIKAFEE